MKIFVESESCITLGRYYFSGRPNLITPRAFLGVSMQIPRSHSATAVAKSGQPFTMILTVDERQCGFMETSFN